ncbi:MAG: hypothetical protein WCO78_02025 [Candidatus Roizmanbacteria bacterium]
MDQDINQLDILIEALTKSKSIALVVPPNASVDVITAACSFSESLDHAFKSSSVISSANLKNPIGHKDIHREISAGGKDLCISFPYVDGSIEKVDYKIENGMFNLIVIPRPGFSPVTKEQLSYKYTGDQPDCIITFDVQSLNDLGEVYTNNQAMFDAVPVIINIDRHSDNTLFGNVNYIQPANLLMNQIVYSILASAQLPLDPDITTLIYSGIVLATDTFTQNTTPEIFETVAALVRAGAERKAITPPTPANRPTPRSAPVQQPRPAQQQSRTGQQSAPRPTQNPNQNLRPQHTPQPQNPMRPAQPQPQTFKPKQPVQQISKSRVESAPGDLPSIQKPKTWIDAIESSNGSDAPRDLEGTQEKSSGFQDTHGPKYEGSDTSDQSDQAPIDWLKPKIMKGNGLI